MNRDSLVNSIKSVRTFLLGEIFISENMSKRMVFAHLHGGADASSPIDKLSDRELEIFPMIGQGEQVREIADRLHISPKTVEAHRARIKEKLNLGNARAVARLAQDWVRQQV